MIFAIQDANILIDLHNTGLLENYFRLEVDTHTTDLVLQEVRQDIEKYVQSSDMKVKTFTAAQLQNLLEFKATQPNSLSLQDCSVFQFAIETGAILLTGESTLRKCAKKANVETHGMIWLFDLMLEKQVVTPKAAIKAMELLIRTNPRLPLDECQKRLRKWAAQAEG